MHHHALRMPWLDLLAKDELKIRVIRLFSVGEHWKNAVKGFGTKRAAVVQIKFENVRGVCRAHAMSFIASDG